jgi:hypothetical protein
MSTVAVTAAQVRPIDPLKATIRSYIAVAAITKGQAVYITTVGKVGLADSDGSGTRQFRGIALDTVGAGQAVGVLHDGEIAGFTVSGLNCDSLVYVGTVAGALITGTGGAAAARVVAMTDGPNATKVLRVFTRWSADWS